MAECKITERGHVALYMRRGRAAFRFALGTCKICEEDMKREAIASKLNSGNMNSFWTDIRSIKGACNTLPVRFGVSVGKNDIVELGRAKFAERLNTVDDSVS